MFREWPAPKMKDELLKFTYILLFLRNYILGRADLTAVLRTAILEDVIKTKINGKSKITRIKKGFEWTNVHQKAFDKIKNIILENTYTGGRDDI